MANDPAFEVAIGSVRLDPLEEQRRAEANNEPRPTGDAVATWIVQIDHPPTADERARLQQQFGLSLTDFVPRLAYIERLPGRIVAPLLKDPLVRAVAVYEPRLKVAPSVRGISSPDNEPVVTAFNAVLFDDADPTQVVAQLEQLDATDIVVFDRRRHVHATSAVCFQVAVGRIDEVSAMDAVRWIEPVGEFRDDAGPLSALQPGTDGTLSPVWASGLHGEGQVIGIIDNGPPDIRHCFFVDPADNTPGPAHRKVLAIRNASGSPPGAHVTFVAGCAAGDDVNVPGAGPQRGGAWAAKLVLGNRNDLKAFGADPSRADSAMFEQLGAAASSGATIHSNSFHTEPQGANLPAIYDITAADVDSFTWSNEDHLVLGSSGNLGEAQGPPGTAKNAVCVAAAHPSLQPPTFGDGATGPTADGRRKPDLMMVGCAVESALIGGSGPDQPCRTTRKPCASSHATPLAAAAAALARQYFVEGFHPSGRREPGNARVPTGALLKAVLLNSTVLSTSGAPDTTAGWGLIDLPGVLFFEGQTRRLDVRDVRYAEGLTTGQTSEHVVNVDNELEPLRVTLVWTEPPGGAGAASCVVNNLDLELTSPDGVRLLGNVYDGGQSTEGGTADSVNNVEMASVQRPTAGDWTITVRATEVCVGAPGQGYAVVATGGLRIS